MKNKIKNANLLVDAFGKFPTFHDSEVVEVNLKRKYKRKHCPTLSTLVYIKNYKTGERFLANLIFKDVLGLKLENFNHQNVLEDLYISDFSDDYFEKIIGEQRLLGFVGKAELLRQI